jgi:hypothetical protein
MATSPVPLTGGPLEHHAAHLLKAECWARPQRPRQWVRRKIALFANGAWANSQYSRKAPYLNADQRSLQRPVVRTERFVGPASIGRSAGFADPMTEPRDLRRWQRPLHPTIRSPRGSWDLQPVPCPTHRVSSDVSARIQQGCLGCLRTLAQPPSWRHRPDALVSNLSCLLDDDHGIALVHQTGSSVQQSLGIAEVVRGGLSR